MKKIIIAAAAVLIAASFYGCGTDTAKGASKVPSQESYVEKKPSVLYVKRDMKLPEYFNTKSKNMYDNLLIVYPDKERGAAVIARAIAADILKNKNLQPKIMKESEIKKSDLVASNLMIIGNTSNSTVLGELKEVLPVYADGVKIKAGNKEYTGSDYGVTYFYPNLFNYNNSMILVMGNSETALKMYDFNKNDIAVYKGTKEIQAVNFKEAAFGKFDNDWKIARLDDVDPKLLLTGENDKLDAGQIKDYPFPEWAKGKVIYQIFVRSFYDTNNDGRGDINGIAAKLDYLKSVGADILWLTPVFDSPSYHGYDVRDYFKIGKDYGTNEDFRNLAAEAHKRGIKILLDIPFNHASKQEPHFKDAYNNPDSKYDKWFYFSNIQNTIYHDWYFRDDPSRRDVVDSSLPAWNTNNPEVVDFHTSILKFWMDPNNDGDMRDGADGFRFDVAKGPSHEYWKLMRQNLKKINPDALMLAELWIPIEEMAKFFDNQFDSAFDFEIQGACTTGVTKDIDDALAKEKKLVPQQVEMARFLSNHDMDRFPTYKKSSDLKLYSTLIYTLEGMPVLYYGDELGMKGDKGDSNGDEGRRRPMEWYKDNKGQGMARWVDVYDKKADGISVEEEEGKEGSLLEHYRKLAAIRRENIDVLNSGNRTDIKVYEEKDGKENLVKKIKAYVTEKNGKKILTILNMAKEGEYKFDFSTISANGEIFDEILGGKGELKINGEKQTIKLEGATPYIYKKR